MRHNLTLVSALAWVRNPRSLRTGPSLSTVIVIRVILHYVYNRVLLTYRIVRCQSSPQRKPLEKQHNRYGNLGTDLGTKDAT